MPTSEPDSAERSVVSSVPAPGSATAADSRFRRVTSAGSRTRTVQICRAPPMPAGPPREPSNAEQTLLCECDLSVARHKASNTHNDALRDRRPALYSLLLTATDRPTSPS